MEPKLYVKATRKTHGKLTPAEFRKLDELLTSYWLDHTDSSQPDTKLTETGTVLNAVRKEGRRHAAETARRHRQTGLSEAQLDALRFVADNDDPEYRGPNCQAETIAALRKQGLISGGETPCGMTYYGLAVTDAGRERLARIDGRS